MIYYMTRGIVTNMSDLVLEKIKLKDIKEYENNANEHAAEHVEEIRDSILDFGYLDVITIDEDNVILEGHGRRKALMQLDSTGEKEIQVIRVVGKTEDQKKAYRLAHNKIATKATFDPKKLGKDFNDLEDTDYFGSTGFDTSEISEIWDKKIDTSSLVEQEKSSTIEHRCPECGNVWEEEIKSSRKRE